VNFWVLACILITKQGSPSLVFFLTGSPLFFFLILFSVFYRLLVFLFSLVTFLQFFFPFSGLCFTSYCCFLVSCACFFFFFFNRYFFRVSLALLLSFFFFPYLPKLTFVSPRTPFCLSSSLSFARMVPF